ncbi:MAG: helix-turn-helix domain-containing protein [Oscillospiraceae bacterium]|nr:helix-turn-helix domain-containing protein [Oscillospiraceae bacterium]
MCSVVIIDDEIHAIQHLKRMLEECVPSCCVSAFYTDANAALKDHVCIQADILFVDIMMPAMNGLDFSKQLLHKNPYAKIILLTAYQDFEYAKQALEIGVFNYWVKHELRKSNIVEQMKGVLTAVDESRQARHSKQRQTLIHVLTLKQPFQTIFPESSPASRYFILYMQASQEVCIEALGLSGAMQCVGSFAINGLQVAVGSVSSGASSEDLCNMLNEKLPPYVTGGLLTHCFAAESYRESIHTDMLSAAENCVFGLPRLLFSSEALLGLLKYDMSVPRHLEKKVFAAVDQSLAALDTQGLIRALVPLWSDKYLLAGNKQALKYSEKRLDELIFALGLPKPPSPGAHTLLSLKEIYLGEIQNMAKFELREETPSFKVRRIRNYIHKRLKDDLQLKKLTREFNISGDYLRKIFKNETGTAISEYITKVRMDEARRLLQTGEYKVYEIAEMVGYNSTHYFSQVYHKETGYYPTEYPGTCGDES